MNIILYIHIYIYIEHMFKIFMIELIVFGQDQLMAAMGLNDLSHLRRALMILSRSASHEFSIFRIDICSARWKCKNKWRGLVKQHRAF